MSTETAKQHLHAMIELARVAGQHLRPGSPERQALADAQFYCNNAERAITEGSRPGPIGGMKSARQTLTNGYILSKATDGWQLEGVQAAKLACGLALTCAEDIIAGTAKTYDASEHPLYNKNLAEAISLTNKLNPKGTKTALQGLFCGTDAQWQIAIVLMADGQGYDTACAKAALLDAS